jgi:predicted dehydrogenase
MTGDASVRIGIIGLGNIGRHHADQLRTSGGQLVGGVDILPEARERFAIDYGVETYAEADDLFSTTDAVIITTPNRFHEEYAVRALEAGLDVLLEKPLAHDVESAERIAAVAGESEPICMVGFHNRFLPPIEVLKDRIDAGTFGEVTHVDANYVRRRGIPGRGSWFTDRSIAGGGALIDIGVHALDVALYLLDFPEIEEVSGVTRSEFGTREDYTYLFMWGEDDSEGEFDVDDSATAFIRCAKDRTISLDIAWAANQPNDDSITVRGTDAGARFDRGDESLDVYGTSENGAPHFSDQQVTTREVNAHAAEQRAFVEAVESGVQPKRNTVEQALAVQRVIDAIYRSSERGEAVRIPAETETTAE